ncbi:MULTISPECIES: NUDIX domain-containing protein [unclassified Acinetobacter]|uniref:NUDIX domain-containing protein n=1 Tax=unclassified Acinetobacter TaxID=196816 RepID=UPI0035BA75D6
MSPQSQFDLHDVEVVFRQDCYKGFVKVECVQLRHRLFADQSWSAPLKREIVKRRRAAGVLICDDTLKQFLLIEQFRAGALNHPQTPWQFEIVAGLIDGDETAEQCLVREAKEEANCDIQDLQHIFSFYPSSGASDEIYDLYIAQAHLDDAQGVFGEKTEGEDIKVHIFDFADIDLLLNSGTISNAPLIIALQHLKQKCHQQS